MRNALSEQVVTLRREELLTRLEVPSRNRIVRSLAD
jgi:hypothetical protein